MNAVLTRLSKWSPQKPGPRLALLGGALLLLAACSITRPVADSATRHVLDPAIPWRAAAAAKPALAVAKPSLPAYLDRQQLIVRGEAGEVRLLDQQLWAEPLDSGIARVLAANLARLSGSGSILPVGSFATLEYDRLLELRIERFDPAPSGDLVLECAWKLQPVTGADTALRTFSTEVPAAVTTPASSGRIAAMNEALARLAREIARSL
jgi:uncharacterized protein